MTAFIGRREFIALAGGAAAYGRSQRARSNLQKWHELASSTTPPRKMFA